MMAARSLASFAGETLGDSLEDILSSPNGRDGRRLAVWLSRRFAERAETLLVHAPEPTPDGWRIAMEVDDTRLFIDVSASASTGVPRWTIDVRPPSAGVTLLARKRRQMAFFRTLNAAHQILSASPLVDLRWHEPERFRAGCGKGLRAPF